jgi:hypothetical protein
MSANIKTCAVIEIKRRRAFVAIAVFVVDTCDTRDDAARTPGLAGHAGAAEGPRGSAHSR